MIINPHTGKEVHIFIEKKLVLRLRIFFFIIFILIDAIFIEMSIGNISPFIILPAMLAGIATGLLFVRRKKIFWEEETSRVIGRMDRIGIFLLVIYIFFAVARHWFLHEWLHGIRLTVTSLSFSAGNMSSRVWSMRRQIKKVLRQQNIIS